MKKIYLLLFGVVCTLVSCLEDKGNDLYIELNDVTIGSIRDTTVEQFTRLKIESEIITRSGGFNAEDYTYMWYMYVYPKLSNPVSADTLSFEKDLDVEINSIPGDYILEYKVTDKATGVTYAIERSAIVTVINSYSKGMMALSSEDGEASVTFVNAVGTVTENTYKKVNGSVAGKNPTGIRYVTGMISSAEPMVVIMTDDERGGTVVKPLDMSYVMDFKDMFYFPPEVVKPQSFGTHDITMFEYVNNNGIIYRRQLANGYPKYGVAVKGEYDRIAPFDFFDATGNYVAWFYDQGRERFVYLNCPLQGDVMIELADVAGEFNPNDVGMQMLWGGAFGTNMFSLNNGRAVMEDEAGERWILSFTSAKGPVFTPLRKIHLTYEGAREAHTFTTTGKANFLYYGYSNKIACVSFSTGNLLSVYEVEGGKVDYIECDQMGNIDQMWVGISDGSGTAKSGSIVVLEMSTDGSLKEVTRYKNVCGKVVDFEYKQ